MGFHVNLGDFKLLPFLGFIDSRKATFPAKSVGFRDLEFIGSRFRDYGYFNGSRVEPKVRV